jgi:serine/threonine protein kinase
MHGTIRNADVLQEGLSTRVTQSAEYDAIAVVHHSDVMQEAYHYVPSYKERVGGLTKKTPTANDDIYAAVEAKYQNCIKSSDKDNAKYKEPSSKLEELYDDLAAMQCLEIPRNYLKFGSTLGSGEFGVVCKGEWLTPQGPREVALKVSHEDVPDTEKVKLLQEAAIMKQFNHPNVVRLLGTVTVSEPPVLVVQYMKNGCLHLHLSELPKEMTELRKKQFLQFSFQIAQGMRYLSNKGFIHRDLATRNVLLDQELECKISDFGLSRNLDENTYYMVTSGKIPLKWTAPEALFYKKFSTSSDVWSYGMTLFEIWSFGESPFAQLSLEDLVQQFNVRLNNDNEEHGQVHPLPEDCPNDMNTLILRCWQFNHHRRPTFCDVVTALESLIN